MATAKRLYLYVVSAAALSLLITGAAVLLRQLLKELGVGPQSVGTSFGGSSGSSNSDPDTISLGLALGLVGLVVWLFHWLFAERTAGWKLLGTESGSGTPDSAAAERRSIVRSVYLALVMGISLSVAASLGVDLTGRVIADALGAPQSYLSYSLGVLDDAWSVSILIVLLATWRYHVWIRTRDVRQGPVITGAAAWVSRTYLYWAVFVGVAGVVSNASSVINTIAIQLASPNANAYLIPSQLGGGPSSGSAWERPVIVAVVGIAVYGAIWLSHWLYSTRLRSGSSEQSAAERVSRVRLAFLMAVVFWGAVSVAGGFSSGLNQLVVWAFGLNNGLPDAFNVGGSLPVWYLVLVPPIAALPAGLAWWWHRRRAFSEAPDGPVGISAIRIAGYLVALVGLTALAIGIAQTLSTMFGEWFAPSISRYYPTDYWKWQIAASAALAIIGLTFWVWPWRFAGNRRAAHSPERLVEVRSASRAWYLYFVAGASVLVGAAALSWVLYRYLRLGFGLDERALGSEVSSPIAFLLVAAVLLAYHALVVRSDKDAAAGPPAGAVTWPAPGPMPGQTATPQTEPTPAPAPEPAPAPPESAGPGAGSVEPGPGSGV